MIDYRAGHWGFHVSWGWQGSLAPRALTMAIPNAIITFMIATYFVKHSQEVADVEGESVQKVMAAFEVVMIFILYNRSRTSYNRWWEGGTLLQKTRGEWFNAYSSIMAFTSTRPEMQDQVEAYTHCLARLMSLLMCCGLQQVSPHRDRPFSILDLEGMEPESMEFLNGAPDKVEVILQWVQRSMVLHMQTGVLPVAPPILSRAFQEVSRGIVNLQNARKIADFPYPYPLAQVSMILQLLHWAMIPIAAPLAMSRNWAVAYSFFSIFVLWCIHFNALDLEFPFGDRVNDLPMHDMQQDWNNSICALLDKRASQPPKFDYDPTVHNEIKIAMSDASALYVPAKKIINKGNAVIKVTNRKRVSISKDKENDQDKEPSKEPPKEAPNVAQATGSSDNSNMPQTSNTNASPSTSHGTSPSTKPVERETAPQPPPIDIGKQVQPTPNDIGKTSPPHAGPPSALVNNVGSPPSASVASNLELPVNDLPKMAEPIFLKRPEVCEAAPELTLRDGVTPAGSELHSTPATNNRGLVNRRAVETSRHPSQVTISLENLYV